MPKYLDDDLVLLKSDVDRLRSWLIERIKEKRGLIPDPNAPPTPPEPPPPPPQPHVPPPPPPLPPGVMEVHNVLHEHFADTVLIQRNYTVSPNNATHGHVASTVLIGLATGLQVQSAVHDHTAENVTTTPHFMVSPNGASHGLTSQVATIQGEVAVQPHNCTHALTSGVAQVTQQHTFAPASATQAQTAQQMTHIQNTVHAPDAATHAHAAENASVSVTGTSGLLIGPGQADAALGICVRAGTNAGYFDSSGTRQVAAANTIRTDYDPVTLELRGWLIEQAATNRFLNSRQRSGTGWDTSPGGTYTANYTTMFGVSVGRTQRTTTGWEQGLGPMQTVSLSGGSTAGRVICLSFYAQCTDQSDTPCIIYITEMGGAFAEQWRTYSFGLRPGPSRHQFLYTIQRADRTQIEVYIGANSGGGTYDFIDGMWQLEEGVREATSWIETTTAVATRNADEVYVSDLTKLGSGAGTYECQAEVRNLGGSGYPTLFNVVDADASDSIGMFIDDAGADLLTVKAETAFVSQGQVTPASAVQTNTRITAAMAIGTNDLAAVRDDSVAVTDNTLTMPSGFTRIYFGRTFYGPDAYIHLRYFKFTATRKTNTELRDLTRGLVAAHQLARNWDFKTLYTSVADIASEFSFYMGGGVPADEGTGETQDFLNEEWERYTHKKSTVTVDAAGAHLWLKHDPTANQIKSSTTSNSVGTGSKTWGIGGSWPSEWANGDRVIITRSGTSTRMAGLITGYSGNNLTVNVLFSEGTTGTFTSWTITNMSRLWGGAIRSKYGSRYGRWECRCKLPQFKGMWPAFWFYPYNWITQAEIDVFEVYHNPTRNNGSVRDVSQRIYFGVFGQATGTITYGATGVNQWLNTATAASVTYESGGVNQGGTDWSQAMHTYACIWTATSVSLEIDGTLIATFPYEWEHTDGSLAPPASVIVNLAGGNSATGGVAGPVNDPSQLPADMVVEYIRHYIPS